MNRPARRCGASRSASILKSRARPISRLGRSSRNCTTPCTKSRPRNIHVPNGVKKLYRKVFGQRQVRTTVPTETTTVAEPVRKGIRLAMLAIETYYAPTAALTVDELLDY